MGVVKKKTIASPQSSVYLLLGASGATTVFLFPFCRSFAECFHKCERTFEASVRGEDNRADQSLSEAIIWNAPYATATLASLSFAVMWYLHRFDPTLCAVLCLV
jgi:hypothetical protein